MPEEPLRKRVAQVKAHHRRDTLNFPKRRDNPSAVRVTATLPINLPIARSSAMPLPLPGEHPHPDL
jgi:hypothetical protein